MIEIGLPMMRIEYYEEPSNSNYLRANLDILEETRDQAYLELLYTDKESLNTIILM